MDQEDGRIGGGEERREEGGGRIGGRIRKRRGGRWGEYEGGEERSGRGRIGGWRGEERREEGEEEYRREEMILIRKRGE